MRRLAAIVGCALAMTGCAVGRKHAYDMASPRIMPPGSLVVGLAVQDQRAVVMTGVKESNFVGLSRGGFGNSFDVTTVSGRPLAADFAISIKRGLERAGYRVVPVALPEGAAPQQIAFAFAAARAERGLVVQISEWKSDTYNNTALMYGVIVRVLDASGQELGHGSIAGNDNLGGSFWNPPAYAEEAVPPAYAQKLEQLLNQPSVQRALAPAPAAAPAPPPADAPSVTPVPAS